MTWRQVYRTILLISLAAKYPASEVKPLEKVNISIYYEGLCPDSRIFITEFFYPAYKILSDYLNVRFIPFGKASIKEDGSEYTCQHGKEECVRNIIHGCALNLLAPGDEHVEFVYCAMVNKTISGQKECARQGGLPWETIQNCVNGEQGLSLTLSAQHDTRVATNGPSFVPTIILNNKFSQETQNVALRDPVAAICKYLRFHPQCEELI